MICEKQTADQTVVIQFAEQGGMARGKAPIILIYSLAGPAIGGAFTALCGLMVLAIDNANGFRQDFLERPIEGIFFTVPFSLMFGAIAGFFFGGIQAFFCGSILAATSDAGGRFTYVQALIAAVAVVILAIGFMVIVLGSDLLSALFTNATAIPSSLFLRFHFRKRFAPGKTG